MFTQGVDVNELCKRSLKGQLEIIELDSVKIDDLSTKLLYLKRDYKNHCWKSYTLLKKTNSKKSYARF